MGKKVLALVIAISLWLVANLQHDVEKNIAIDINYANLPPGLRVVNNPPEKLNVRVRGPRSQLSSITSQNMLFTIDLSNISSGMSKFEIGTDQITPPRDVQVTGISPAEIKIEAAADWVVCGEVCIPGGTKLSLELNVSKGRPLPDTNWAPLFESFIKAAPQVDSSYRVSSKLTEKALIISVAENSSNNMQIDSLIFFPEFNGLIKNAASQKLSKDESGYVLEIERDPMGVTPPERLRGILVLRKNNDSKTIRTNIKFDVLLVNN
ncbi:MAG: hypothetical protein IH931_02330 [candidate division Zixibacteria bacterium]|nr:hypothetical protein [candidate division Zixibacteria bacterium]